MLGWGLGSGLRLPAGQHLCGLEQGKMDSNVAAETEVRAKGKCAMCKDASTEGRAWRTPPAQPAREGLGSTCMWPGLPRGWSCLETHLEPSMCSGLLPTARLP